MLPSPQPHTVTLIMKNKEGEQWGGLLNKYTESMQFNQSELIRKYILWNNQEA